MVYIYAPEVFFSVFMHIQEQKRGTITVVPFPSTQSKMTFKF